MPPRVIAAGGGETEPGLHAFCLRPVVAWPPAPAAGNTRLSESQTLFPGLVGMLLCLAQRRAERCTPQGPTLRVEGH